jgi:hypothetical protein
MIAIFLKSLGKQGMVNLVAGSNRPTSNSSEISTSRLHRYTTDSSKLAQIRKPIGEALRGEVKCRFRRLCSRAGDERR